MADADELISTIMLSANIKYLKDICIILHQKESLRVDLAALPSQVAYVSAQPKPNSFRRCVRHRCISLSCRDMLRDASART